MKKATLMRGFFSTHPTAHRGSSLDPIKNASTDRAH